VYVTDPVAEVEPLGWTLSQSIPPNPTEEPLATGVSYWPTTGVQTVAGLGIDAEDVLQAEIAIVLAPGVTVTVTGEELLAAWRLSPP
jgi:hypothetical protein